jgi:Mrp family chromosome partitioning ATPase
MGLFHFLTDNSVKVLDVINHYDKHNFDIIEAGKSNEYSTELLSSDRFEEILNYGSNNYEYVIIEVPSINVDSDTLRLAHYADLFLYVVRANYLSKRMLDVPKKLIENERFPNINILMNDLDYKKLGYNNPQAGVKKSFWEKF